jgi:putative DNA primase/helicase
MVETASAKGSATYGGVGQVAVTWDGKPWSKNQGGALVLYAVETACAIFRDAERVADEDEQKNIAEWAIRSHSLERLKAMWTLAKADLAVSPEELDTDPMLLNVENGTIDLRTGSLRPHRAEDLITKLAPVEFEVTAEAPTFERFLKQVLVEDELIAFVQRFLGYSLTGSVEERAMAVLHGVGKNGKSTLVELFQDLLGDYSTAISTQTLMNTRYSDATTQYQLAVLNGVRFISAAETKKGQELDETVVKHITGGDTITARAPYGQFFTYRPQFKIWMSTNHKPEIPDGSEAIWDRLRLVPFNQRFADGKADKRLPQKLREELSGVLLWAVEGCVEWYQNELGSAPAVEAATAKYRAETDVYERFFGDVCVFGPEMRVGKTDLFNAWERWCTEEGEDATSLVKFSRDMRDKGEVKGFEQKTIKGKGYWKGIAIREEGGGETLKSESNVSPPLSETAVEEVENASENKPSPSQKSCKHEGGESDRVKVSEDFPNSSINRIRVGSVDEIDSNLHPSPKPSPNGFTTPLRWTEDGVGVHTSRGE